jgi:hypothetical protein
MPLSTQAFGRQRMDLAKVEESLEAAGLCDARGLDNSSVSRASYALLQAAQVALEAAGFTHPPLEPCRASRDVCQRTHSAGRVPAAYGSLPTDIIG